MAKKTTKKSSGHPFNPALHPRDEDGKFAEKNGGSGGSAFVPAKSTKDAFAHTQSAICAPGAAVRGAAGIPDAPIVVAKLNAMNKTVGDILSRHGLPKLRGGVLIDYPEDDGTWVAWSDGKTLAINAYELAGPSEDMSAMPERRQDALMMEYSEALMMTPDDEDRIQSLAEAMSAKCCYAGEDRIKTTEEEWQRIMTHEMGHHALTLAQQNNPALYDAVVKQFRRAKKSGSLKNISAYSMEDAHEFFAESFVLREMFGDKLDPKMDKLMDAVLVAARGSQQP